MFKPQALKKAIILARMKDDQLTRQRRFVRPVPPMQASPALPLSIEKHYQPMIILSDASLGKKCSRGEPRTYVLIVMNVLLQGTNVKGHGYSCWKCMMATTLS